MRLPRLPISKAPPVTRKLIEEQLKLAAGGLQLLALAMLGAGLIAPLFNGALTDPLWMKAITVSVAAICEGAAFTALRYITFQVEP